MIVSCFGLSHFCSAAGASTVSSAKEKRGEQKHVNMEGNYLTAGDLAMWDTAHGGRRAYGYDDCGRRRDGMAATGIGLAAGLGGGALLLALAGIWGANQASKARYKAAENAAAGNAKSIDILAQTQLQDRLSRETWQNNHAPTISQYVDVRAGAGAGAGAGANALAAAEAMALASAINNNSNGLNSAIGGCNFLRVARYSASKPCGCDTCQD